MRRLSSRSIAARLSAFALTLVAVLSLPVLAASPEVAGVNASATSSAATELRAQPSALLTIDQNRTTVVDRVVREWGDTLVASNVGLDREQLRAMLTGLRSDHLLAASLAGSLEGLRNSLATALASSTEVSRGLMQAKALGDTADDLVYTPVMPCRLADTRFAGGPISANTTRNFKVWVSSGGFTAQGGDAGNCNVPFNPPAVVLNFAAVNPGGTGNLIAYPTGGTLPNTSVLNYQSGIAALSNGAIIPACVPSCTNQLSVKANGPTVDVVIDIVGYFARPKNYGGTHVITGFDATDSGGFSNTASGDDSTVAGGGANTASGYASTVAGGLSNTASGIQSTVAGGANNTASGSYSFAAGYRAKAGYGSFVWSGPENFDFDLSGNSYRFAVRATGAINMVFAIDPTTGGPTQFCNLIPGLPGWQCTSDRNVKENFVPADGRDILRRLVAMPLFSWNFKGADPSIRSLGPTAQDFHAAFGLGNDDLTIASANLDGVALAAIQGLHRMLQEKQRKISRLEAKAAKVDRLERRLQALEAKLGLN